MSMNGCFRTASDATLARLKANPDHVPGFLGLDDFEAMAGPAPTLRLVCDDGDDEDHALAAGAATAASRRGSGEGETLDLEKAWHGLHFLLTGSATGGKGPLGYIMEGGVEVGEDLGYGPARALSSAQVRDFAVALAKVTDAEMRRRFDPAAMERQGVYPNVWDEGDEAFDWLAEYAGQLKSFIARAAQNGMGMLAYMI